MYKRLKKIKKLLPLYIMALPALVYLFINNYLPLTGMVVAFKDFDYSKGIYERSDKQKGFKSISDSDSFAIFVFYRHYQLSGICFLKYGCRLY